MKKLVFVLTCLSKPVKGFDITWKGCASKDHLAQLRDTLHLHFSIWQITSHMPQVMKEKLAVVMHAEACHRATAIFSFFGGGMCHVICNTCLTPTSPGGKLKGICIRLNYYCDVSSGKLGLMVRQQCIILTCLIAAGENSSFERDLGAGSRKHMKVSASDFTIFVRYTHVSDGLSLQYPFVFSGICLWPSHLLAPARPSY